MVYYNNSWDRTHPVAKKKANGYGLYDMSGNVGEWCWYSYGGYHCGGDYNDDFRILIGNSFHSTDDRCEVGSRSYNDADGQYNDIGFRVVCNADN